MPTLLLIESIYRVPESKLASPAMVEVAVPETVNCEPTVTLPENVPAVPVRSPGNVPVVPEKEEAVMAEPVIVTLVRVEMSESVRETMEAGLSSWREFIY
mgnify:CR=1 FL=1